MITKISGIIDSINELSVIIENSGVFYSVRIPPVLIEKLSQKYRSGDELLLYTHYYIEGGVGVGNLFPKLNGFLDEEGRRFFEIFTTVKGLGEKKALQALVLPFNVVAKAIEQGDVYTLKRLPGIGGRMADKIIAELRGKLTQFVTETIDIGEMTGKAGVKSFESDAMEILIEQLGYRRVEAENLIRNTIAEHPEIESVEELVQNIFKKKAQAGGA
jgi:Holliday junction DNA helicase RuvA